ncbi:hypothetical protein EWM64_g10528, partial [Hericium alpestre]
MSADIETLPNARADDTDADARLHALGYKPEFRREMSLSGVLGISFCAIGILTGMSSAFQTGLFSGGPLGLFWGWNYVYPPNNAFTTVCTGWIYSIAMIFTGTSGNLSVALYIASLAEVGRGVSLSRVEIAAIAWSVNVLSGIMNTV